ncbi:hypothetical protein PSN45_002166 [Yamadazyma tenuis]|uniref:uncharacterized protein n=1 Tax=Candida tenuis TaxID=2315449 RepID=UPI0027A824D7|nr:hypothetical protein PSN45_002166 [Yamadazyma tenuis]
MWVLRYEDSRGNVLRRNLKHGHSYEVGRDIGDKDEEFFIQVHKIYISKKHLSIQIKSTGLRDVNSRSELCIQVLTKASSVINGTKHRLSSTKNDPYVETYTESDVTISFKDDSERIFINWIPLVVYHQDMEKELQQAYDSGVDLKLTTLPNMANAIVVSSQVSDHLGAIAMIYNLPIMTKDWVEYVKTTRKDVFDQSDITTRYLFRENYATKRSSILSNYVIQSADFRKEIETIVTNNGGTFKKRGYELLEGALRNESFMEDKFKDASAPPESKFVIYHNTPSTSVKEFAAFYEGSIIGDTDLFRIVKDENTDCLQPLNIGKKKRCCSQQEPEVEVLSSQVDDSKASQSWRRRKKVKKSDALAFLLPSSLAPDTQPSLFDSPVKQDSSKPEAAEFTETNTGNFLENREVDAPINSVVNFETLPNGVENNVNVPSSGSVKRSSSSAVLLEPRKRQKLTVENALSCEDLELQLETEEDKRRKKRAEVAQAKREKNNNNVSVGFLDAVKSTKEHMNESIKKDLGLNKENNIPEDSVESMLETLAIVETVDIKLRKRPDTTQRGILYEGRKNFKNFKKNMTLKSRVTRTFVSVGDPSSGTSGIPTFFEESKSDDYIEGIVFQSSNAEADSQPIIPPNDLFVSNESQSQVVEMPSKASPARHNTSKPTKNPLDDFYDDDLDDMPRFQFTRN